MEDILASIRKILNEEEAPAAATSASPAAVGDPTAPAPPAPQVVQVDDLPLDLTEDMLVTPPGPPSEAPSVGPVPAPPAPLVTAAEVVSPAQPEGEGIVAPATAAAAAAIIGQLARTVAAERHASVSRGGPSIEDVVREEIRPMLQSWLDTHLPPLVERLVRAEIERVMHRAAG
ncbi:DUF2497 domain-containing protein [Muricoccus radiodurans]|uniref:DUF2497 domain-containing protein n=1 Tax=Muricoccus radiodurans TaxID=2231721 RepID=UPI003CF5E7FE